MIQRLKELLIKHEGIRLRPYRCSAGKLTIGIGRNLDDVGISLDEANYLLEADIQKTIEQVSKKYAWFSNLDPVRKDVIINMVFNLGISGFSKFHNLIAHLSLQQYLLASIEMIESKWADQVGSRAKELAHMMKTGEYTDGKFHT